MSNIRNNKRAKGNINDNDQAPRDDSPDIAGPSTATPAINPNGDGNGDNGEGGGQSDVSISNVNE